MLHDMREQDSVFDTDSPTLTFCFYHMSNIPFCCLHYLDLLPHCVEELFLIIARSNNSQYLKDT